MTQLVGIQITAMDSDQIKKQAIMRIENQQDLVNSKLGSINEICQTCHQYARLCPGHYSYIQLPFHVFNPILWSSTQKILKMICLNCFKVALPIKDTGICSSCKQQYTNFEIVTYKQKTIDTGIPIFIKCPKFRIYQLKQRLSGIVEQNNELSEEMVVVHPSLIHKLLCSLVSSSLANKITNYQHNFMAMMIDAIPVPGAFIRQVNTEQDTSHAISTVYINIIRYILMLNDFKWIDDCYLVQPIQKDLKFNILIKLIVACRVAMYKDTSKNIKPIIKTLITDLLSISATAEPASCLSKFITKYGIGRQIIASVRVNMSGRTVIVGNPWLKCDQLGVPQQFAETLFTPYIVNNLNIELLKGLILRYPQYPCATVVFQKMGIDNYMRLGINENNKELQAQQLEMEFIVGVQLLNNQMVLVNRYPSLQEQSFTALRVKIFKDSKSLQFPISIIKKMNADFDGDEMQIFGLQGFADQLEAISTISVPRQLISYETGLNMIGGAPNLNIGIYHLQNDIFTADPFINYDNDIKFQNIKDKTHLTGIDVVNEYMKKIDFPINQLNYDDGKITIKNGQFQKFDNSIASSDSKFLVWLSFNYGNHISVQFIDTFIRLAYLVNMISASTINPTIFINDNDKIQLKNINKQRINNLQQIIEDFYNQKLIIPPGFDEQMFFEKVYTDRLYDNVKTQQDKLLTLIEDDKNDANYNFYKSYFKKNTEKVFSSLISVGQQYDQGKIIYPDNLYQRTYPSEYRFSRTPQQFGYVENDYLQGLSQKEMFVHALGTRYDIFKAKQSPASSGYFARRLNQGTQNTVATYNGIITSDNLVVALQYGTCGYDPRCYIKLQFDFHRKDSREIEQLFGQHPHYPQIKRILKQIKDYEQIYKTINPQFEQFTQISVPFIPDKSEISKQELDNIFSCRICSQMGKALKDIIKCQSYLFYVYCLFYMKVVNKQTNIINKYLQSLLQAGEPVGMKASLAISQPLTQSLLSAIHSKDGIMSIIQLDKSIGLVRVSELIMHNSGPSYVQFKLLNNTEYNKVQFVSKYQTIEFHKLNPVIQIKISNEKRDTTIVTDKSFENAQLHNQIMFITLNIVQLGFMNINIINLLQSLSNNQIVRYIVPIVEQKNIVLKIYFNIKTTNVQIINYKSYLLTQQLIGPQIFYNLHYSGDYIYGNIYNKTKILQQIYKIKGIDPWSVYCSSPQQIYDIFGIFKCKQSLYLELVNTLTSETATKELQICHIQLLVDILTNRGIYGSFTRNQYRKTDHNDIISKLLFEQGNIFLEDQVKDPQLQSVSNIMTSCIYGTVTQMGTTTSKIMFNNLENIQNQQRLLNDF